MDQGGWNGQICQGDVGVWVRWKKELITAGMAHSPKRVHMSHDRREISGIGDGIRSQGNIGGFAEKLEV